jgi:hypothetical protein
MLANQRDFGLEAIPLLPGVAATRGTGSRILRNMNETKVEARDSRHVQSLAAHETPFVDCER